MACPKTDGLDVVELGLDWGVLTHAASLGARRNASLLGRCIDLGAVSKPARYSSHLFTQEHPPHSQVPYPPSSPSPSGFKQIFLKIHFKTLNILTKCVLLLILLDNYILYNLDILTRLFIRPKSSWPLAMVAGLLFPASGCDFRCGFSVCLYTPFPVH